MVAMKGKARLAIACVALALAASCVASYRNHGYMPSREQLDEIVVGVDTRDSVAESVGSPSSSSLVDESGYYYVKSRMRSFAYRAPEVIEREVLAISFDANGIVRNIERFGLEDGRVITLERRVTESSVVDQTFLRQILGSFGRIAAPNF